VIGLVRLALLIAVSAVTMIPIAGFIGTVIDHKFRPRPLLSLAKRS
jgi:hypothetical protein